MSTYTSIFTAKELSYLQKIHLDAGEYKTLFERGLELIEKEPRSMELLHAILDEYQQRLDELPPMEISLEQLEKYDSALQEKIKSLILFGAQAAVIKENARTRMELERARVQYRNLLDMISHEFKNSLTSIFGYNRMIKKYMNESPAGKEAMALSDNVERLIRNLFIMLDTLLNMARLDDGKVQLNRDLFDVIRDVIEPIRDELEIKSSANEQEVVVHANQEKNLVYGDLHLMQVAFRNLLLNAIQYGDKNTKIHIDIENQEKYLRIKILNFGSGIQEEFLPKIFEKFTRFHRTSNEAEHSGLGLYTVKNIVELHGGSIHAESKSGRWMKFIIHLPKSI